MLLTVLSEEFSVIQVSDISMIDLAISPLFIGQTTDEISVVLPTKAITVSTLNREDYWKVFKIDGVLDFSLVGILAKLATILAEQSISIFALSTFNTDYILVKTADFEEAKKVLLHQDYQIQE
ncbi:hypothetical protein DOK78_001940 [Enterococcus sp. DIV2402]|uniref:CASTOR ACT domain-containing protein n=1 Tax=Candidatus Enterococcus lowellii TaxID=2230877 RepID=A0ABZ2SP47_9ENTE|nr:ACT domain-containing protein [Enterococcus sp. DIV2402]MBO0463929.1 ACT domain-containing protein [Enterococcus sp. DIV2402]